MKLRRGYFELEKIEYDECDSLASGVVEILSKKCLPHFDPEERISEAKSLLLLCPFPVLMVVQGDLQHAWWWEAVIQALAEAKEQREELMLGLRDAKTKGHITAEQLGQATEIARQSKRRRLDAAVSDAPPASGEDSVSSQRD